MDRDMTTLAELNEQLIACRRCPRLVEWRERVAREKLRFLGVSIDEPTEEQRVYQQSWRG